MPITQAYRDKLRIQRKQREYVKRKCKNRDDISVSSRFFYTTVILPERERIQCIRTLLQRDKMKAKNNHLMKTSFTNVSGKRAFNIEAWIQEALRMGIVETEGNNQYFITMPHSQSDIIEQINPVTLEVTNVIHAQRIYVKPTELRNILMGELSFQTTVEGNKEGSSLHVTLAKENLTPPGERQKLPKWYTKGMKDSSPMKHKKLSGYIPAEHFKKYKPQKAQQE